MQGQEKPLPPPSPAPLPALYAPEGVAVQATGFSGGPDHVATEAAAETDRSVAELEAHFAQQLVGAGWLRQDGAAQGPLAWSTWRLPDEGEWSGFLYVLEGPAENERALAVRVESAPAQPIGTDGEPAGPPPAPPSVPIAPAPMSPPTPTPISIR
jgi:hypothetical protein